MPRSQPGETHGRVKLTEALVSQIRTSDRSDQSWADELGTHRNVIRSSVRPGSG